MLEKFPMFVRNKTSLTLIVIALVIGGVSAQASGLLNSTSGGYLVCVAPKTTAVTHPAGSSCPRGYKQLILGAKGQVGATGLNGATGLAGKDGRNGIDGKTLWNGVKDPESTWGAPGDMFINATTKTLFGPKDLATGWPVGVSMVGPQGVKGETGAQGSSGGSGATGATGAAGGSAITELSICGAGGASLCKVGVQGPGGGIIFFVDYRDIYASFNYLEAAPADSSSSITWCDNTTTLTTADLTGWDKSAVGRGQANTTAMLASCTTGAARSAHDYISGGKSDWFLGSLGEMMLMYTNLRQAGVGGFVTGGYWSSSEVNSTNAWIQYSDDGTQGSRVKSAANHVRPVRAF